MIHQNFIHQIFLIIYYYLQFLNFLIYFQKIQLIQFFLFFIIHLMVFIIQMMIIKVIFSYKLLNEKFLIQIFIF